MSGPADITLRTCVYGGREQFPDRLTHVKTAPETIIAQCLAGRYEVWCDGLHELIEPGEVFVVGAMRQVRITHHHDAAGRMAARWVHAAVERLARVDALAAYHLPLRVSGAAASRIGQALDGLRDLGPDDGRLRWQVSWRHHAWALVDQVLGLAQRRDGIGDLIPLEPVFRMVDRGLHEELTVADLAASLHLSEARFHVVFKAAMGCTPKAWLQRQRLQRAAHELLHTDDSIQQVAARCGFKSPFHFSRAFKAWCGVSPRRWRVDHGGRLV